MRLILFIILAYFSLSATAQDKKLDVDSLMNKSLSPEKLGNIQFINSTTFAYIRNNTLFLGNNQIQKSVLTLKNLNNALQKEKIDPLAVFPDFQFTTPDTFVFLNNQKCIGFSLSKQTPFQIAHIKPAAKNVDINYKSMSLAYTVDNHLYIHKNGKDYQVSNENNKDIVYGQSVHRNEFGIKKGTFWSPKGNLLAFYRMDESMVSDYPLINTSKRIAVVENTKYPMAGMKSHEVSIGVYDTETEKTVYLKTQKDTSIDEREMYLTNITWHPNQQYLYVVKVNRKQTHLRVESYEASTGNWVETLFEEQSLAYVEPESGLFFLPDASGDFVWLSQKDGYRHCYLYTENGILKKQLTTGKWVVKKWVGFDKDGKKIFFYSNIENPLENALYSVNIGSGKVERITPNKGIHEVVINDKASLFIDSYNNTETPFTTQLLNLKGKVLAPIFAAENPLKGYQMPEMEMGNLKAGDNETDVYYRMYKPANLEAGKKYPTLLYVYGGPHSQLITESWLGGGNNFFLFLAQQGYIVFTLDNRGTAHRGFAFESAVHHRLGEKEMEDQMKGIAFLKSLPFVDTTRIGVDGWSYGGFMALSLKLNYPDVFKIATAGGPVIDWKWYEIMYGERYMGSPDDNPEGYKKNSLIPQINRLKGKVLIIHGAQDPTVVWQHSLEFLSEAIRQKKQIDYFVYPAHEHNVRGIDRTHLYRKLYEYYEQNL